MSYVTPIMFPLEKSAEMKVSIIIDQKGVKRKKTYRTVSSQYQ